MKKSKIIALGISLLLSSLSGASNAGESSFYHPDEEYDFGNYQIKGCLAASMVGYTLSNKYVEYKVLSMPEGGAVQPIGMDFYGNYVDRGNFWCIEGTIYYEGSDYTFYSWSPAYWRGALK